ncbi:hypothetical protein [Pararhizobium haloflavum]|uniref:hypothetical protein n=1 Tax=Pararhizobium haloflavum TaxID=2037914 RepID=UPI000C19D918|nr:hypothetical protein [Pararhizobium haloflavum]
MSDKQGIGQRWNEFRPTKAVWLWSCAGCIVATMVVGFTYGGWVTGGTAAEMAADASETGRAELAATLCVNKFASAPNATEQWASLKEASSWERDDLIEDGGWAALSGNIEIVDGSLDLCAERLVAMEQLPAGRSETAATDG